MDTPLAFAVGAGQPADLCDLRVGPRTWLVLTVLLRLARAGARAGFGADGHHGLSDGALPAVAHLPADARRRQGRAVQAAVVLANIVDPDGRDQLEAVGVAGLRKLAEVLRWLHLEDLRQRDLLQGQTEMCVCRAAGFPSSVFGGNI